MSDSFFTNRELALLVALIFWAAAMALLSWRGGSSGGLLGSVRGLLSAITNKTILLPVFVYLCWLSAASLAAEVIGLWDVQLVKAAVLWLLLSGLGLFGTGIEAVEKEGAIASAFKRLLGVIVVFEFVAGAASFPWYLEIPTQIVALPCSVLWGLGSARPEYRRARKVATGYLSLLGLAAIAWGITRLVSDWEDTDWGLWWRELVMPFWLTPVALTFMALLALYLVYEATFSVMRSQSTAGLLWKHRLAVLVRCGPHLRAVRAVRPYASWLANDPGFRTTWRWTSRVLRQDRDRRADEAAKAQRLIDNAGVTGTDSAGTQLDRREHAETKEALRWLYTCHLGHYSEQSNRYIAVHEDIIDRLSDKCDLPRPNHVEVHIAGDGQSWYATRRTITGHWFAIGAAVPPTDQWFYDGPTPPHGFPTETEWDQWVEGSHSPNWVDSSEAQPGGSAKPESPKAKALPGRITSKSKSQKSGRPSWCRHYDEWKRAAGELEALQAQNTEFIADWTKEDLARLDKLIQARGEAANRMWDEAPESETWTSAHLKCG